PGGAPMFKQLSTVAFACVLVAGCRDDSTPLTPLDLSMGDMSTNGTGGNGTGGGDMAMPKTYASTKIADMRTKGKSGSFELTNVVAFALTPSTNAPHLFVQDAGGGPSSAMETQCSASSGSHKCSVNKAVAAIKIGNSVTVKGTYLKATMNGVEDFYI